jgi:hypothetical protein
MKGLFKFSVYDKVDKSFLRISSLNFDDSGLVQVSGFNAAGKLIHIPISEVELEITGGSIDQEDSAPAWLTPSVRKEVKEMWESHKEIDDHMRSGAIKLILSTSAGYGYRISTAKALELLTKYCL